MSSPHTLVQEVTATAIPAGHRATLPAGTRAHVVQSLGGNVTVRTDAGLFRIDRDQVAALLSPAQRTQLEQMRQEMLERVRKVREKRDEAAADGAGKAAAPVPTR